MHGARDDYKYVAPILKKDAIEKEYQKSFEDMQKLLKRIRGTLKEEDLDLDLFQRRKVSMSFQMKELLRTDPRLLGRIRRDVNCKAAVLFKYLACLE